MHIAEPVPALALTALAVYEYVDSLGREAAHRASDPPLQPTTASAAARAARRAVAVRPFAPEDASAFLEAVHESAESVGQWLPWCHAGYTLDEATAWMQSCRTFWDAGHGYNFAVVDAATDELLGSVGVDRIDQEHLNANVGYWVKASCAGQGIAAVAVELMLPFAFFELKLHRLEIVALCENLASIRVAEKLGARFECIARHRITLWDRPRDAAVFSLLPNDIWPEPLEEVGP